MNMIRLCTVAVVTACCIAVAEYESEEELMRNGGNFLRSGSYSHAISSYKKILNRDSRNFEAQFNMALAYLLWGRYRKAITEFTKATRINPKASNVWASLGVAYERLGQNRNAISAFRKAVRYDPENTDARMNLATVYINLNQINKAIAEYKNIIRIDGYRSDAYAHLGKCLISKQRPKEAKIYLEKSVKLDPNNAGSHFELGTILWKHEKKPKEAAKQYRIAIDLDPNQDEYYRRLALLHEEYGNIDDALKVWREYLAYSTDAYEKEKVQKHMARLRTGGMAASSYASQATADSLSREFSMRSKQQMDELKKELRDEEQAGQVKRIDPGTPPDVLKDLEEIESGGEGTSDSIFELPEEMEKVLE